MAIVVVLYIVASCFFSMSGLFNYVEHAYRANDNIVTEIYRANGTVETHEDVSFPTVNRGDKVVVHLPFSEERRFDNAALCFVLYHSALELYDGDSLIYEYGSDLAREGRMIGSASARVAVPDDVWGRELTLVMYVTEDSAFSKIPSMMVMDGLDSLKFYQIGHEAECATLIAIIFIFGLFFVMIACQPHMSPLLRQGLWLSVFCIIFSLWLLAYENLLYYFIDDQYIISIAKYLLLFAIPIPFFMYLSDAEIREAHKRRAFCMAMSFIALFVVATIANFTTRTWHYVSFLPVLHVMAIIAVGVTLEMILRRHGVPVSEADKPLHVGLIILMITVVVEIIRYRALRYLGIDTSMLAKFSTSTGMVIFMMSLSISYFSHFMEHVLTAREKEKLEAMAYSDVLTGLPNRAALFRDFSNVPMAQDYAIAFFDLNSLKKVNDLKGHDCGDAFIKKFAEILIESFREGGGTCYRVGGDEFIGVMMHNEDAAIDDAVLRFEHARRDYNEREDRIDVMSASYGIVKNDVNSPKNFEELLKKADDIMYVHKMAYKKAHFRGGDDRTFLRDMPDDEHGEHSEE